MNDSDDDTQSSASGYATPSLSPTKTVSTEGWLSPKTPLSPRKTRSCRFIREYTPDCLHSHPKSPTKHEFGSFNSLASLQLTDAPELDSDTHTPPSYDDSIEKKHIICLEESEVSCHVPFSLSNARLSLEESRPYPAAANPQDTLSIPRRSSLGLGGSDDCISTRSLYLSAEEELTPPITVSPVLTHSDLESPTSRPPAQATSGPTTYPLSTLRQLALRSSSSPLRPSQWAARGEPPTITRRLSYAPDRFIAPRRPPHVTKQSFDLNKPEERLKSQGNFSPGISFSSDPFNGRLRRSTRMNEELRGLRQSHAMLTGRLNLNRPRPNPRVRRQTVPMGARQISVGAVWNVGGSSAASDTVLGVSNGNGGLLGIGTNAPLYTSMVLSRSDPDAELEAYERRIALALDIDQVNRVLDHSTPTNSPNSARSRATPASNRRTAHVWTDNAWTRNGILPR